MAAVAAVVVGMMERVMVVAIVERVLLSAHGSALAMCTAVLIKMCENSLFYNICSDLVLIDHGSIPY